MHEQSKAVSAQQACMTQGSKYPPFEAARQMDVKRSLSSPAATQEDKGPLERHMPTVVDQTHEPNADTNPNQSC